jgi:hypothetical protein
MYYKNEYVIRRSIKGKHESAVLSRCLASTLSTTVQGTIDSPGRVVYTQAHSHSLICVFILQCMHKVGAFIGYTTH